MEELDKSLTPTKEEKEVISFLTKNIESIEFLYNTVTKYGIFESFALKQSKDIDNHIAITLGPIPQKIYIDDMEVFDSNLYELLTKKAEKAIQGLVIEARKTSTEDVSKKLGALQKESASA